MRRLSRETAIYLQSLGISQFIIKQMLGQRTQASDKKAV